MKRQKSLIKELRVSLLVSKRILINIIWVEIIKKKDLREDEIYICIVNQIETEL